LQPNIKTKASFARELGLTRSRISQFIAEGKVDGDALVIVGQSERINADVARRQLGRQVGGAGHVRGETVEAIQRERLAALQLTNERSRAEALSLAGRFVEADAMRAEVGRIAGRLVAAFDGVLPELAEAVAIGTGASGPRRSRSAYDRLWQSSPHRP
jgi:predicted transcriptional regulator